MNAITILAAVATVAAVLVPALAELTRISDEQPAASASLSFGTEGEASEAPGT